MYYTMPVKRKCARKKAVAFSCKIQYNGIDAERKGGLWDIPITSAVFLRKKTDSRQDDEVKRDRSDRRMRFRAAFRA